MVRRLLPVRMFNKQEHLGSFYSTKANMTVLISVPPSHTDLRSMRHVFPPPPHFRHSCTISSPTRGANPHIPIPFACVLPRATSHSHRQHRQGAKLHRDSGGGQDVIPAWLGGIAALAAHSCRCRPVPALTPPRPSLCGPLSPGADTPRSSAARHAGRQELKLGREANRRVVVTQELRRTLFARCRIVFF